MAVGQSWRKQNHIFSASFGYSTNCQILCQAYEKEDETPAAVPAEKKEKAAEKVKCPSE